MAPITTGTYLVQAVMTTTSGLPEDKVCNSFVFDFGGPGQTTAQIDGMLAAVDGFYRATQAGTGVVGANISTVVDRSATHELKVFNVFTGGSPVRVDPWLGPVAALGATNLPNEVAAVLSFHGNLTGQLEEVGTTRPAARRRGRVFIGPLRDIAIFSSVGLNPVINAGFRQTLREAATKMYDDADAVGAIWSVWSRADGQVYPVVGGWTDDAPDTQRRRGQASTARQTFTTV